MKTLTHIRTRDEIKKILLEEIENLFSHGEEKGSAFILKNDEKGSQLTLEISYFKDDYSNEEQCDSCEPLAESENTITNLVAEIAGLNSEIEELDSTVFSLEKKSKISTPK